MSPQSLFIDAKIRRLQRQIDDLISGDLEPKIITQSAVVVDKNRIAVKGQQYPVDLASYNVSSGDIIKAKNIGRTAVAVYYPIDLVGTITVATTANATATSVTSTSSASTATLSVTDSIVTDTNVNTLTFRPYQITSDVSGNISLGGVIVNDRGSSSGAGSVQVLGVRELSFPAGTVTLGGSGSALYRATVATGALKVDDYWSIGGSSGSTISVSPVSTIHFSPCSVTDSGSNSVTIINAIKIDDKWTIGGSSGSSIAMGIVQQIHFSPSTIIDEGGNVATIQNALRINDYWTVGGSSGSSVDVLSAKELRFPAGTLINNSDRTVTYTGGGGGQVFFQLSGCPITTVAPPGPRNLSASRRTITSTYFEADDQIAGTFDTGADSQGVTISLGGGTQSGSANMTWAPGGQLSVTLSVAGSNGTYFNINALYKAG